MTINNSDDALKNCWDPLEPAYDIYGNLKTSGKKVTWSYNNTIKEIEEI